LTGRRTGLAGEARRALRALSKAKVPHAVIGAVALAARGLPRMTQGLGVVVRIENAFAALDALRTAGLHSVTPINGLEEPEARCMSFLIPIRLARLVLRRGLGLSRLGSQSARLAP